MKTRLRRAATGIALALAGTGITACGGGSDAAPAGTDVPLPARIGNVATAELRPANASGVSGTVVFSELDNRMRIEASVMGLSEGLHGIHIHQNGDCSAADASSAGGHWAPDGNPHGAPTDPPGQHHAGDLGNLSAGADGKAMLVLEDPELALAGDHGVVGHSVIVHAGADDLKSQPSGNSGQRIACGVIEYGTVSN
jgi:Cu-Zn family superoxide dismutase